MTYLVRRLLALTFMLTTGATLALCNPPYGACNSFVGYMCVTPFLLNTFSGNGKGNYTVQVTPSGGSQSNFQTVSSGQSQGYIVLIGGTSSTTWLIAPSPSPCSWSPSFQNWTQSTGYDPNNPGGTVGVPSYSSFCP